MYPEFRDKVAVVTGAGSGIGRAIAQRFGREQARVVVNDLRPGAANKVVEEITAAGGHAVAIPGDMTKEAEVNRLFDQVMGTYGRLEILVNNVGLFEFGTLVGSTSEQWDRDFAINVRSAFLCSNRAALEMKKARTGCIVNIASRAGKVATSGARGYGAAKAAMLGLTRSLAAELAPDIRVNAVCPGTISTGMDDAFVEKIAAEQGIEPAEYRRRWVASIPMKRVGTPEDVANAVAFLSSDQASHTTGEAFNVSGGLAMH